MNIEQAKADLLSAMSGPAGKNWGYGPAVQTILNELDAQTEAFRKLTIENLAQREVIEAVRAVAGQSEGIAGWHQSGVLAGWDEILPEVFDLDMSESGGAAAELKAQGVEAAIEHLHKKFEGAGNIGVPVMALEWLAQQLREAK